MSSVSSCSGMRLHWHASTLHAATTADGLDRSSCTCQPGYTPGELARRLSCMLPDCILRGLLLLAESEGHLADTWCGCVLCVVRCPVLCCVLQSRQQRPQEACSDHDACEHPQGVGAATGAAAVRVGGPLGVIRECWLPACCECAARQQ